MSRIPYMGGHAFDVRVDLPMDTARHLRDLRIAKRLTLRALAREISLIDKRDAAERALAHDHRQDFSGLTVSSQTLGNIENHAVMGQGPIEVRLPTAALIAAWLKTEPSFATPYQRESYRVRWLPVYHAELRQQGKG